MARRNIDKSVKDKYLDWLMAPPSERDPSTKLEVAVVLGVVPSTLYLWENTTQFQDELRQLKIKWGVKFHGEILGRLMSIVTNGTDTASIAASKVLLPHIDTGPREVKEDDLTEEEDDFELDEEEDEDEEVEEE
ncbi:hypothetical protein LCGC14_2835610 [marine sediment metagenome]|uniref:Homeodomain phBC6A51-type domain-containing protein n=1 Tax=marine sediment metagenome TaxID=412755 RepID=A0A0F8YCN1_9ZZZZ